MKDPLEQEYENLASEKKDAIDAMLAPPIGDDCFLLPIVDGPPGTGKTHTATIGGGMYVRQDPSKNKVIYTAFTNFALDRAKEELDKWFPPSSVVRLTPNLREKDWQRGRIGCDALGGGLSYEDMRRVNWGSFLLCTPFMLGRLKFFGQWKRAMVIFDEFSQIDVPTFFMVLGMIKGTAPRGIILFGDPLQLPVVTTQEDLYPNIANYLGDLRRPEPHRLAIQFRMHDQICQAVNRMRKELARTRVYPVSSGHELISAKSIRERGLEELGYAWEPEKARKYGSEMEQILDPSYPLVFIDTSEHGVEQQSPSKSWFNRDEADLAARIVKVASESLKLPTKKPEFPKVITPYTAQSRLLKEKLPGENVLTVYKAQGREYPFVVISMVRSNDRADVGFLNQPYLRGQGYVALSRAMGKMIVLMAEDTFAPHPVFETLVKMGGEECLRLKLK